jgi:hypothetical protein
MPQGLFLLRAIEQSLIYYCHMHARCPELYMHICEARMRGGILASAPTKFEAFMHGATEWTSGPQVVGHRSIVGMSSGGVSMQVRLSSMMCCKSNEPSNSVASVFHFWFRLDRLENPA